jgi:hypothetical protein
MTSGEIEERVFRKKEKQMIGSLVQLLHKNKLAKRVLIYYFLSSL